MSTGKLGMPDIFEYLDYRAFLRDWFDAKKALWAEFSYEYFNRLAGLGSKATLANVISGRRNPRPHTVEAFARGMELNRAEAAYLQKLVDLAMARTLEERRDVLESILEEDLFQQDRDLEEEPPELVARMLSRWYCMAIRELARGVDFVADPAWLARTLNPKITESQAAEALEILFALGMLQLGDDGQVRVPEIRISTASEVTNKAIYQLYRTELKIAERALTAVPPSERHYATSLFLVAEEMLPELKLKIENFTTVISSTGDDTPRSGARVYMLGVQLFPLTDVPEAAQPEAED